jgi:hypothetical protein
MRSVQCYRAMQGWFAGCLVATAVLCSFALALLAIASDGDLLRFTASSVSLLFPALLILVVICVVTGIPAAAIVWLSEKLGVRSILFFGCAGIAIGGITQTLMFRTLTPTVSVPFILAGLAAGLVYWRVAGRYAGQE